MFEVKVWWSKLIATLVVLGIFGGLGYGATFITAETSRTYYISEEFKTLEDAFSFQEKVVNLAVSKGAKIRSSELTVLSPPKMSIVIIMPYQISSYMPEYTPFEYGSVSISVGGGWTYIIFTYVFILAIIFFILWMVWFSKEEVREKIDV